MPAIAPWHVFAAGWVALLGAAAALVVLLRRASKRRAHDAVRVRVEFPEGSPWADRLNAELLWALPLGGDLYEIRNFPFHAPGLHCHDVVRAVPAGAGEPLTLVEVVRRGGHRTARVVFAREVPEADRHAMLASLNPWRASYENGDDQLFAVNIPPDGDLRAVHDRIGGWIREGKLACDPWPVDPDAS